MKKVMAILLMKVFMLFHALSKIRQQSSFHSPVSDVPAPAITSDMGCSWLKILSQPVWSIFAIEKRQGIAGPLRRSCSLSVICYIHHHHHHHHQDLYIQQHTRERNKQWLILSQHKSLISMIHTVPFYWQHR